MNWSECGRMGAAERAGREGQVASTRLCEGKTSASERVETAWERDFPVPVEMENERGGAPARA